MAVRSGRQDCSISRRSRSHGQHSQRERTQTEKTCAHVCVGGNTSPRNSPAFLTFPYSTGSSRKRLRVSPQVSPHRRVGMGGRRMKEIKRARERPQNRPGCGSCDEAAKRTFFFSPRHCGGGGGRVSRGPGSCLEGWGRLEFRWGTLRQSSVFPNCVIN